ADLEVLWPERGATLVGNDTSTVVRVRARGLTALLAGDLEEEGIRGLLRSGRDLRADVLVLPHHGRPTPAAADLLRAVRPRILVSSGGPDDVPDPAYRGAYRTTDRGAVTVRPGARVETFR
ncbi:MAG: ComEC/Rec2 family competence protein, partial [Planctomycetota bacterium]